MRSVRLASLEGAMRVYCKLVADLLVGDYLQVVSQVPSED
jgi:hypothetical protein